MTMVVVQNVRLVMHVAYDGTNYEGFHTQLHGNTIQNILERRLSNLLDTRRSPEGAHHGASDATPTTADDDETKTKTVTSTTNSNSIPVPKKMTFRVVPAGRTDAGVHAKCQIVHFDVGIVLHDKTTAVMMSSLSFLESSSSEVPIIGPNAARHIRKALDDDDADNDDEKPKEQRLADVLEQTLIGDATKVDHKIHKKRRNQAQQQKHSAAADTATSTDTTCTIGEKRLPPDIQVLKVWPAIATSSSSYFQPKPTTNALAAPSPTDGVVTFTQNLSRFSSSSSLFHSRHSCIGKRYVYTIQESSLLQQQSTVRSMRYRWILAKNQRLDLQKMKDAAAKFLGIHDFRNFGFIDDDDFRTPIKKMRRLDVERFAVMNPIDQAAYSMSSSNNSNNNNPTESIITITAECDRFLYNMMRMISGSLVQVGLGRMTPDDIESLLLDPKAVVEKIDTNEGTIKNNSNSNNNNNTKNKTKKWNNNPNSTSNNNGRRGLKHGILKAPAHGLCLHHCFYEPEESLESWMGS